MERCYSIREGHLPIRDDTLPDRFFNETIYSKYGDPKALDKDLFLEQRRDWYMSIGLDEYGIPPKAYLKKLGLEFATKVMEEARAASE